MSWLRPINRTTPNHIKHLWKTGKVIKNTSDRKKSDIWSLLSC